VNTEYKLLSGRNRRQARKFSLSAILLKLRLLEVKYFQRWNQHSAGYGLWVIVLNKTSNRLVTSLQPVLKMRQRSLRLLGFGGRSIEDISTVKRGILKNWFIQTLQL
jgi:hypothetical protein